MAGMSIELNAEQQRVVNHAIQAGVIRSAEDVVEIGIDAVRERLENQAAANPNESAEEWLKRFEAWTSSHRTDMPLLSDEDISRDSIYGNRGM